MSKGCDMSVKADPGRTVTVPLGDLVPADAGRQLAGMTWRTRTRVREWRCGFPALPGRPFLPDGRNDEITRHGPADFRVRRCVMDDLCIRPYWRPGRMNHESLLPDSH
jgi:hypothetical protein